MRCSSLRRRSFAVTAAIFSLSKRTEATSVWRRNLAPCLSASLAFSTTNLKGSTAPSGTVDCLQGNLCWALLELGYDDPRLARAFEWMARTVTGEGIAPAADRNAVVRYYAYKCGPGFACGVNNQRPCAWGAIKGLLALARGGPVIDIGCADGALAFFLESLGMRVHALNLDRGHCCTRPRRSSRFRSRRLCDLGVVRAD